MRKDLGEAGEGKFKSWCSDVGITANKANEDKYGWDFIVEIPVERSTGISTDLHKSNMTCKIQVKSTEGKKQSKQVELSNLHVMATDELPVFYLFLHFDKGKSEPVNAYLVYLDQDLIERILKIAREKIAVGLGNRLNKTFMTISYDETHRLPEASGYGFLEYLRSKFFRQWHNLVESKKHTLRHAGFDGGNAHLEVKIKSRNQADNLVRSSLGYGDKVEISELKLWGCRFGIKDNLPFVSSGPGLLSIKPYNVSGIDTRLMIYGDEIKTLVLNSKFHISPFSVDFSRPTFRIHSEYIDIFVDVASGKSNLTSLVSEDVEYPAKKLSQVVGFFASICKSGVSLSFALEKDSNFLRLFNFVTDEKIAGVGWEVNVLNWLDYVISKSSVEPDVPVSISWLRKNEDMLFEIYSMCRGDIIVSTKGDFIVEDVPFDRAVAFLSRKLEFGSRVILYFFTANSELASLEGNQFKFKGKVVLEEVVDGPNDDMWMLAAVEKVRDKFIDRLCGGMAFIDDLPSAKNGPRKIFFRPRLENEPVISPD